MQLMPIGDRGAALAKARLINCTEKLPALSQARLRMMCRLQSSPKSAIRHDSTTEMLLGEVRSRLGYLLEVGLGYLTLDRPTRTLSGGEVERVNLTTCLGASLVNTLFVLDEPSIGLHPRDIGRLSASCTPP